MSEVGASGPDVAILPEVAGSGGKANRRKTGRPRAAATIATSFGELERTRKRRFQTAGYAGNGGNLENQRYSKPENGL